MLRTQSRLAGYILPLALGFLCIVADQASAQRPIETVSYSPLTLNLTADSPSVSVCATGGGTAVRLNANANSPGGNPIRYRWSTTQGRINGEGPVVSWDLSGLAPGYYKATVEIETGNNDSACQAFSSTNVLVTACPPVRPVCPAVAITCPSDVLPDQQLTFSSSFSGGSPSVNPIYNWTVSAGTIVEGQGTNTIKVDTKGLTGQTVRATLSMGGYTLDCSADCAVSIPLPRPTSRKFDEFPDIARNDEKARLDNFAIELQNDPTSTGYVIVYTARNGKAGDGQKHTARVVDYLVNSRGLDAHRIVTMMGGTRDELMVELWVTPQGAVPPRP